MNWQRKLQIVVSLLQTFQRNSYYFKRWVFVAKATKPNFPLIVSCSHILTNVWSQQTEHQRKILPNWSSKKEHKENALALGADERRGKLRKASGRCKQPSIRRFLNGETYLSKPQVSMRESIAYGRERCELKHLSSSRRRKKTRFPK